MGQGSRNSISSIPGIERKTKELIRIGYNVERIKKYVASNTQEEKIPFKVAEDIVDTVCKEYPDYPLIQKIMRSKLVLDIEADDDKYHIVDEENRKILKINPSRMRALFSSNFSLSEKIYTASLKYRPDVYKILIPAEDCAWVYNTYVPPKWFKDVFYSNDVSKLEDQDNMPKEYEKFLMHLVDGDKESFDYIVDWLATAIKSRNHCILCTIGAKGIGKGVLGEIMKELVGSENFCLTGNRILKSTFNSQLKGKKIIYCDEVMVTNTQEEDNLKLLINENLEVEQKGVDATVIKNYANIYLSSNNLDSIRLSGDNRRFSIVNLTDNKLMNIMKKRDIERLAKDEDLIGRLARYLFKKDVDEDKMLKVFTSARTEEVRLSGLKDWQYWTLFDYGPNIEGTEVRLKDFKEDLINQHGNIRALSWRAIKSLQDKFPEKIELKKRRVDNTERREFFIKFHK